MADANGVALRGFNHHRLFLNDTHTQDGHLRLVNDRCATNGAKGAEVGQCKGAALNLVGLQLAGPGAVGSPLYNSAKCPNLKNSIPENICRYSSK